MIPSLARRYSALWSFIGSLCTVTRWPWHRDSCVTDSSWLWTFDKRNHPVMVRIFSETMCIGKRWHQAIFNNTIALANAWSSAPEALSIEQQNATTQYVLICTCGALDIYEITEQYVWVCVFVRQWPLERQVVSDFCYMWRIFPNTNNCQR